MAKIVDDTLAPNPDFSMDMKPIVPELGFVRHRRTGRMTGRGRWDRKNEIFRCIILCPTCDQDVCNQRMWTVYDDHDTHDCRRCHEDKGYVYDDPIGY